MEDSQRLAAARLAIAFSQGRLAMLISPVIAVLASYALWPLTSHKILVAWVSALVVFSVLRTMLSTRYHQADKESLDVHYWNRLFILTLIGTCLAWGIGGWLVMMDVDPVNQAFLYFFLLITTAGAITSYGALEPSSEIVLSLILGPPTIYMLYIGDRFHVTMGVAALLFAVVAIRGLRLVSGAFRRSLLLSDELEKLSRTDPLSGLHNRRAYTEYGEIALAAASRSGRPCAMFVLDVDDFKSINDRLGHSAGDLVIRELGKMLASTVRVNELAARIGGEEFAVILPDTTLEQAKQVANRVLDLVHKLRPTFGGVEIDFTVSIGVTASGEGEYDFGDLFTQADNALYDAKRAGRDRVMSRV